MGVPGSFMSNEVRPALFRVHEFDVGEKKQDENKEQQQEPLNAPGTAASFHEVKRVLMSN